MTQERVDAEMAAVAAACCEPDLPSSSHANTAPRGAAWTPNWKLLLNLSQRGCSANLTESPKSFLRLLVSYERHRTGVLGSVLKYEPNDMLCFCEEVHSITRIKFLPFEEREQMACNMIIKNSELARRASWYMNACVIEQTRRQEERTAEQNAEEVYHGTSMDGTEQTGPVSLDGSL